MQFKYKIHVKPSANYVNKYLLFKSIKDLPACINHDTVKLDIFMLFELFAIWKFVCIIDIHIYTKVFINKFP